MHNHTRKDDGKYHINGKVFDELVGRRAQVMHGTVYKTSGGLTKSELKYNKHNRIVSRKKSTRASKDKRLEKAGYFTKKGTFGAIKNNAEVTNKKNKTKKKKKSSKKRMRS